MTRIITGTADVTSGSPNVTVHGLVLSAINCPADSAITLAGQTYYVLSLTDTTTVVLTRNYAGTTTAGVPCEISALTADQTATSTANQQLATLIARQSVAQTGMQMLYDGASTSDSNPGPGFVRGNDPTTPTIFYISKSDVLGNDISGRLASLDDSVNAVSRAVLSFAPADGSPIYTVCDVTGAITDATGYVKVPVTLRAGSVPGNRAQLAMTGVPSGKDGSNGASPSTASNLAANLGIAFSVSSGALTAAIKQADGSSDPAAAPNSVIVGMRSATAGNGAFNQRSIASALSMSVTSGATLGHANATAGNLYWYLIDNAGTLELAVTGTDIGESGIVSTTAMSAAADLGSVMYSTTARTNVPYRKIAQTVDTQTTAGTWAAVPSTVNLLPLAPPASVVDGTTLQNVGGTLSVKDGGITAAKMAVTLGSHNRLINGNGTINQRIVTAPTDDTYGWDRHNLLTQTAAIAISTLSNVANGLPSMMRMTQSQATAQRMGNTQIVESLNCVDLRGKTVTLLGKLRNSLAAATRYAILEWTGTADAVTSDVVNSWTNSTFTAGQFFNSTTLNVLAVGAITPTAAAVTDFLQTVTVGNSANNLIVMIWTETAQAQNSTLDVAWELLDYDATGKTYPTEFRPLGQELALCQRYYAHSFLPGAAPAQGVGSTWIAGFAWGTTDVGTQSLYFPTPMRATPTMTLYKSGSGSGTTGNWQWYDGVTAYEDSTTSTPNVSEKGFNANLHTTGATLGRGYIVQGNWSASAEL